jgi:ubiquinone/menaquinone biosynthesis C-methylase UbiE
VNAAIQLRVQRYGWDLAEPRYDSHWARHLAPAQRRLLELAAVAPGERVLDVACGTGSVTIPAAWAAGQDGHVLATDISEAMVRRTATEAWQEGLGWVETRRANAEDQVAPDGTVDVALCAFGLTHVPDPVRALIAMYQALRPGGRVVVAVWGARELCGWAEAFSVVGRHARSDVCPHFELGTGDALSEVLATAGFPAVASERMTTMLRYRSASAAASAVFEGGPLALAYSRLDVATRMQAHADYLSSIAAHREGRGYAIPGEFVVARAIKPAIT